MGGLDFIGFLDDGNNKGYGSMWYGFNVLLDEEIYFLYKIWGLFILYI